MRVFRSILVLACLLWPATVFAQASITGTVKDSSGAVLPGVTVEAAGEALIEKVRTAVTDGTGQYRIVDLRPGTYTVTFTLTGFSAVKREGIELTGSFNATVNAEMRRLPVDRFGQPAVIQPNGRLAYDLGVYRVKSPAESKRPWDYYERIATVPAATAFRPAASSGCSLAAPVR